jgi:hypothetical protein
MNLRARLAKVEKALAVAEAPGARLVCTDTAGIVLDDGSEATRPYVGRHVREVPGEPKVVVGVDPIKVLGRNLHHRAGPC